MSQKSNTFRFASWLALLVMTLNALWPLLANARPAGAPSLTEICTSAGMKVIAADSATQPGDAGAGPASESGAAHGLPHCPLCSLGTDRLLAPPGTPWQFASSETAHLGQIDFIPLALARNDILAAAQPRAPPVLP